MWMIRDPVSVNAVQVSEDTGVSDQYSGESDRAFTRFRWNALRQRMAEEESGAWGCVDKRRHSDIDRSTNQSRH